MVSAVWRPLLEHCCLVAARVQVTTYSLHVPRLLSSEPWFCLSAPSLIGRREPTRLSNQPLLSGRDCRKTGTAAGISAASPTFDDRCGTRPLRVKDFHIP